MKRFLNLSTAIKVLAVGGVVFIVYSLFYGAPGSSAARWPECVPVLIEERGTTSLARIYELQCTIIATELEEMRNTLDTLNEGWVFYSMAVAQESGNGVPIRYRIRYLPSFE